MLVSGARRREDSCTNALRRRHARDDGVRHAHAVPKELERLHSIYAPDLKKLKGDEFQALLGQYFFERDFEEYKLFSIAPGESRR